MRKIIIDRMLVLLGSAAGYSADGQFNRFKFNEYRYGHVRNYIAEKYLGVNLNTKSGKQYVKTLDVFSLDFDQLIPNDKELADLFEMVAHYAYRQM